MKLYTFAPAANALRVEMFLREKKLNKIKKKIYFYTIKDKNLFNQFKDKNLIFENL